MAEIVIAPKGEDAIKMGGYIDDDGQRFVGVIFETEADDRFYVSMTIPSFREFADNLGRMADLAETREYWRTVPRRG